MKKIILKVIVLLALTTLVGCGEIANTDINLPENENNQQQKVDIDYAELEPYLRYFYMQYGPKNLIMLRILKVRLLKIQRFRHCLPQT